MTIFKSYTAYYYFDNFISKVKGNLLLALMYLIICVVGFLAYSLILLLF